MKLKAKSGQLSFYGNHICDQVIPEGHFLKLLDKVADFSSLNELCQKAIQRKSPSRRTHEAQAIPVPAYSKKPLK